MQTLLPIISIAFDFDGTLIDSASIKSQAFGKLFRKYGSDIEKAVINDHLASEGVSRFVKFERWYKELLSLSYSDSIGIDLSRQFNHILAEDILRAPWMPGALEFISEWHAKIPLFLISATPQHELCQLLESRSAAVFFRSIWGFPTQKHLALQMIFTQLHTKPVNVLMVGDAEADHRASLLSGASFCRFIHSPSLWPVDTNLYPCLSDLSLLPSLYQLSSLN